MKKIKSKGFTLLEIISVVVILGLLSGFVIIQMQGGNSAAEDAKRKADVEIIKNAIIAYKSENYNNVPIANCNIGKDCSEQFLSLLAPYIGSIPDPDSETTYSYLSTDGTDCSISAVLSDDSIYEYNCSTNDVITEFPSAGQCGLSNLQTFDAEPQEGLCLSGTPTPLNFSGTNSAWSWNCEGENTGADVSCLAYYESNYFACSAIPQAETCSVSAEHADDVSASAISIFKISNLSGGHAEIAAQTNYPHKICCEGSSLDVGSSEIVLRLSSVTNAHVEKDTSSSYSNNIGLTALLKTITCDYDTNCSNLGEDYSCVASISAGDTNLHVGDCSAYATKVCCQISPQ